MRGDAGVRALVLGQDVDHVRAGRRVLPQETQARRAAGAAVDPGHELGRGVPLRPELRQGLARLGLDHLGPGYDVDGARDHHQDALRRDAERRARQDRVHPGQAGRHRGRPRVRGVLRRQHAVPRLGVDGRRLRPHGARLGRAAASLPEHRHRLRGALQGSRGRRLGGAAAPDARPGPREVPGARHEDQGGEHQRGCAQRHGHRRRLGEHPRALRRPQLRLGRVAPQDVIPHHRHPHHHLDHDRHLDHQRRGRRRLQHHPARHHLDRHRRDHHHRDHHLRGGRRREGDDLRGQHHHRGRRDVDDEDDVDRPGGLDHDPGDDDDGEEQDVLLDPLARHGHHDLGAAAHAPEH
mmetsp:Transcript_7144/g.21100  ORF Transcript_7144/g.21100 Transcript_7144/m.21100 type:complete len:351 (-) Transcript_7144:993-2045(-)